MSLHVVATIPIDPARAQDAATALRTLAETTRGESGCIAYEVYESSATPGLFVTVEEWQAQSDLDAHMQTPHVATAIGTATPMLLGEIEIHPLAAI